MTRWQKLEAWAAANQKQIAYVAGTLLLLCAPLLPQRCQTAAVFVGHVVQTESVQPAPALDGGTP